MPDREKYYLNRDNVRKLAGKTIKEISREGESIMIEFTDGTGIEVSGDRPTGIRLMVFQWLPKNQER